MKGASIDLNRRNEVEHMHQLQYRDVLASASSTSSTVRHDPEGHSFLWRRQRWADLVNRGTPQPPGKPRFVRAVRRSMRLTITGLVASIVAANSIGAEPVTVRYSEGIVHGFLVLKTLEGQTLADGDLIQ